MNKKALSKRDICSKFITPAIKQAGWDLQSQLCEELNFTVGYDVLLKTLDITNLKLAVLAEALAEKVVE